MLACGFLSGPVVFTSLAVLFVGFVVPVLNLGALTAAASRPGHNVPSVRRIGWWAVAVGCVTTLLAPFIGPAALIGLLEVVAGLATLRLNARR